MKGLLLFSYEKSNYDVLLGKMVDAHVQCTLSLLSDDFFLFPQFIRKANFHLFVLQVQQLPILIFALSCPCSMRFS